ncbi:MAG: hypothetical protein AAB545_02855 [Patescibacteria group bacterium]
MSFIEIKRIDFIRFRRFLLALLFIQGVTYAYFLHATVSDVVRVEDAEKNISALNSKIGIYEGQYLTMVRSRVTLERARNLGFIEAKEGVAYIGGSIGANRLTSAAIISQ